jgi:hypothetical protein
MTIYLVGVAILIIGMIVESQTEKNPFKHWATRNKWGKALDVFFILITVLLSWVSIIVAIIIAIENLKKNNNGQE